MKKKGSFKKFLLGLIVLIVVGGVIVGQNASTTEDGEKNNVAASAGVEKDDKKEEKKEKFTHTTPIVSTNMGMVTIEGTITNNTDTAYNIMFKVTLADDAGTRLVTARGAMPVILPGETKAYKAVTTGDVTGATKSGTEITTAMKARNVEAVKNVEFGDLTYKYQMGVLTVDGTIKNTGDDLYGYTLTVAFYDKDDKFIGTADAIVANVGAGKTVSFTALGSVEIPEDAKAVVQVNAAIKK